MNDVIKKVLVIGGGTAGMSAAIELRKRGIDVDLIEIDERWRPDGAGISVNGPMLRALGTLGLIDDFLREGSSGDGIIVHSPDGAVIATTPIPRVAGPDIPPVGGIMRGALAKIMAEKVKDSGARVFLGQSYASITDEGQSVVVEMKDGRRERYDLVIVSDGLYSKTRDLLFPHAPKPGYAGQAVWRAVLPRPDDIKTIHVWLGIKGIKPGVNPISKSQVYLFVSEDVPVKTHVDPATFVTTLKGLLDGFSCPVMRTFQSQLNEDALIVYRPLEGHLMREPWYRGRIVMIGDTVHGTTPQLTAGAMMGIEDGIVIAEEIEAGGGVDAILGRFFARRFDRCRLVVENSGRLGQIEINGGDEEEYANILRDSVKALAQPI